MDLKQNKYKYEKIYLIVEPELKIQVLQACFKADMNTSEWIRHAIKEKMEREGT